MVKYSCGRFKFKDRPKMFQTKNLCRFRTATGDAISDFMLTSKTGYDSLQKLHIVLCYFNIAWEA